MGLKKLMVDYAVFNNWANRRFADWLLAKPDELLYREVASSFTSLITTVHHMREAEEYWYSLITETPENQNIPRVEELSREEIFSGLLNKSVQLETAVKSYAEDDLLRVITPPNPEFQCELPRYQFIQHIFNHQAYHRGQIVTMGHSLGIFDAPSTGYNIFHDPA